MAAPAGARRPGHPHLLLSLLDFVQTSSLPSEDLHVEGLLQSNLQVTYRAVRFFRVTSCPASTVYLIRLVERCIAANLQMKPAMPAAAPAAISHSGLRRVAAATTKVTSAMT